MAAEDLEMEEERIQMLGRKKAILRLKKCDRVRKLLEKQSNVC